jgi:hypothetical protein
MKMKMTSSTLRKGSAQVTGLLTPGSSIGGIRVTAWGSLGVCRLS